MRSDTALWLVGGAALAALLYSQRQSVGDALQTGEDVITAAIAGWKQVQQGPVWVPIINTVETQYGIPPDLLARVAYQESHFRQDIIDGTTASSAGALGIMQLMPQYFTTVNRPRPYTATDTSAQIQEAAAQLARLYNHFGDWACALAGYNDGQGNVDQYLAGSRALPTETTNYVADILADVSIPA